jgi:DnaK suppressor protein
MIETATRNADLRRMLCERQRELQHEVQRRIRDGRADRSLDVLDDLEQSDTDSQGDIALALIQMRAETLVRIDEALVRLDAGKYGSCFACEREISQKRLQALPFAVRCQACEERREQQQGKNRALTQRNGGFSLFPEAIRA